MHYYFSGIFFFRSRVAVGKKAVVRFVNGDFLSPIFRERERAWEVGINGGEASDLVREPGD